MRLEVVFMPFSGFKSIALIAGSSILIPGFAPAQQTLMPVAPQNSLRSRPPAPKATMRTDMKMVLVPVTVTDSKDQPVMDLEPDSFRVFEDNIEQKITSFSREDGPGPRSASSSTPAAA